MQVLLYATDDAMRDRLLEVLRERGHAVYVAETAEAARTRFADHPPDLVVIGPSADGLQVAESMRTARDDVLIVFVCEQRTPAHMDAVFDAGADDCILRHDTPDGLSTRFQFIEQYMAHQPSRLNRLASGSKAYQQAVVAEVGRRALAGTEREVLLAYTSRVVAQALQVDRCEVFRYLSGDDAFLLKAGVGCAPNAVGTARVDADTDGQIGYTIRTDEPVRVADMQTETRFDPPPFDDGAAMRSAISAVIGSTPNPYGVVSARASGPDWFTADDVYFLQSVANVLAGAVERGRAEQALRESEAKARAILETTVEGIITIDARGHIESFNDAAEDIFGYDSHEVVGKNVKVLMPSPYKEEHDGYLRSYHETGRRRIIGIGREVTGQRKDGSTFPMELAVSEVDLGDRQVFTGIVRDISERRKLEKDILKVSEQERRRIGQDLHDGLGQMLTGIGLLGQNLTRQLEQEDHPLAEDADEITSLLKEADQYARDLSRGLTPVDLEPSGLSEALQRLSDNAIRLFDVDCTFKEVETVLVHDSTTATHLYRIAQEAVSNAVRHGDATRILITLAAGENQIRLRVRDDGSGFDTDTVDGPGRGVHIMNYRARIIGGTLDINSALGEGTVVTCTLPREGND
jgi:PAS domain S-box-containing protein